MTSSSPSSSLLRASPRARATFVERIGDIPALDWDACAANTGADPLLSHAFLRALEETDCVSERYGWGPRHLVLRDEAGAILGAMPLYLKGHSQGEFVFDHAWADALERAGGDYYPKLLCASPFTPAPGPRLLVAPGQDAPALRRALLSAALAAFEQTELSSLHINFALAPDMRAAKSLGMMERLGIQRIWRRDPSWRCYSDFLAALTSRRRKALRRERAKAREGVAIRTLIGADIREAHWDAFYACHLNTLERKWGVPYLSREAFSRIAEALGDNLALVVAARPDGAIIAVALHVFGPQSLRGRYWGAIEARPFLHFELCYHMAMEIAFDHGAIRRVEAGAQGEHKTERGYLPRLTRSAHAVRHPGLRAGVARFVDEESRHMRRLRAHILAEQSPFKAVRGA